MEVRQTKLFMLMYLLYLMNSLIVTAAGALSFCS